MTPLTLPRALPITLAAAGLLLAAHGAQAASDEAAVEQVHVVAHLPLRDACPTVDTRELADELVDAWEAASKPSSVTVDFKLQRQHVYDVQPATDLPRVYHQIRHAVHSLNCDSGDDRAHAVRFVVRFVDGDSGARVATITEAEVASDR
jgi:hypothetical protein